MSTASVMMGAVLQMTALFGQPAAQLDPKEVVCLAKVVHNESRGESFKGQVAVAFVVLNRADGSSICATVSEPGQFNSAWKTRKVSERREVISAVNASLLAVSRRTEDPTKGANFFNTKNKRPSGMGSHKVTLVEGRHVFYKGDGYRPKRPSASDVEKVRLREEDRRRAAAVAFLRDPVEQGVDRVLRRSSKVDFYGRQEKRRSDSEDVGVRSKLAFFGGILWIPRRREGVAAGDSETV